MRVNLNGLYPNIKIDKGIYNMKIIHIGPLPPPLGGISVFLYRLKKLFPDYIFVDESRLSKWGFIKAILQLDSHVFYHSPNLTRRLFIFIFCKLLGNNFTLVCHGDGLKDSYVNSNIFMRYLIRSMLRNATGIHVVNKQIAGFIKEILKINLESITVRNAFLSPPLTEESDILLTYNNSVFEFLNEHSPIILANASALVFYKKQDLYGLDICIELIAKLKESFPKVGLIFALADASNVEYLNKIEQRIEKLDIKNNLYFLTGQKELWPLFKRVDIMVRPTCSDGYGISIAEALYFGCPAVASDVCTRPEGTILFKNRDLNDFYNKVVSILKEKSP